MRQPKVRGRELLRGVPRLDDQMDHGEEKNSSRHFRLSDRAASRISSANVRWSLFDTLSQAIWKRAISPRLRLWCLQMVLSASAHHAGHSTRAPGSPSAFKAIE